VSLKQSKHEVPISPEEHGNAAKRRTDYDAKRQEDMALNTSEPMAHVSGFMMVVLKMISNKCRNIVLSGWRHCSA